MSEGQPGLLYIAHIEPGYRHARHYIGWTADPEGRWGTHLHGHGSPLIRAAVNGLCVVTFYILGEGTREDERRLHKAHNGRRICPACKEKANAQTA